MKFYQNKWSWTAFLLKYLLPSLLWVYYTPLSIERGFFPVNVCLSAIKLATVFLNWRRTVIVNLSNMYVNGGGFTFTKSMKLCTWRGRKFCLRLVDGGRLECQWHSVVEGTTLCGRQPSLLSWWPSYINLLSFTIFGYQALMLKYYVSYIDS